MQSAAADRTTRVMYQAVVFLSVLLLVWQAWHPDFLIDDAFISLRYAVNLLAGNGLVFNPGERVEGYTNFVWVLAGALALKAGLEPIGAYRVLGIVAGAALVLSSPRLSLLLSPKARWLALLPAPLLALSTPFALWCGAGLETSLFTLLVTGGVLLALGEGWRPFVAVACLTLACLTRPEGHLFAGLALGAALLARGKEGAPRPAGALPLAVGLALAVLLGYHLWRFIYFGHLLPNTFAAKVSASSGGEQLRRGLSYLKDFFFTGAGFALPLTGAWISWRRRGDLRLLLLGVCTGLYLLYVALVGGDSMHGFRFIVPVLPLLTLLFVEALAALREAGGVRVLRGLSSPAVVCLLALLCGSAWFLPFNRAFIGEAERQSLAVRRWAEVGRWMGANLPRETSLALGAVGAIPYYSGLATTDLFGLTDPVIARTRSAGMGTGLAGHERSNVQRVLARRPTLILSYAVLTDRPLTREEAAPLFQGTTAEREIWSSEQVGREYELAAVRIGSGYLNVLARRDRAFTLPG